MSKSNDTTKADPIAAYESGSADANNLASSVQKAWNEVLADPADRSEVARLFKVSPEVMPSHLEPPVKLEVGASGTGVVETALILFITTVGYDLAKDLTKDAAKAAVLAVWNRLIKPRIERNRPLDAFGKETSVPVDPDHTSTPSA